jgi:dephospho-CoA kinase
MKIIGICGGSGSGKSTVCDILSERGYFAINTDIIYHGLIERSSECSEQIINLFGEELRLPSGGIDRKKLAALVFGDKSGDALRALNKIAHYHVLQEVRYIISSLPQETPGVLVDAPLLFESGFDAECDTVLAVIADKEVRVKRIMERDGITESHARSRIGVQLSNEELLQRSDFTIVNNGNREELTRAVLEFLEKCTQ